MLYPQINDAKKAKKIFKTAIFISISVAVLLIVFNHFTNPKIRWAEFLDIGIIYVWITVKYALSKNINIASNLFVQLIVLSAIFIYLDSRMGFNGWSVSIAVPILIIITNVTMLVLSIVSYNNYMRYSYFQLLIVVTSFIPIFLINENIIYNKNLTIIATSISGLNFLISLIFHFRDLKSEVSRRLHI